MSAIAYLHELDAKATTWESRVQIACALAIIEAVQGETGGAEDGRVPVTVSRRSDDKETISFDGSGFTTVRACRDCGVLIVGGPNRCLYCANKPQTTGSGDDVLSREAFLRHLHTIADAPRNEELLHPSEVAIADHDAALRRRTGLSAEVLGREESDPVHALLSKRGIPEQIPPFKAPRASLYVRVLAALTERDAAKAALAVAREGRASDAA